MREIEKALFEIQQVIGNVIKSATNEYFDSNYATLESVKELIMPHANKHKILVLQTCGKDADGHFVKTQLIHESGQEIDEKLYLILDKVTMQGLGSAITYARRYSLVLIFGIGQEDDDGNNASNPKSHQQAFSKPSAQPIRVQPKPQTPQPAKVSPIGSMAGKISFGKFKGLSIQEVLDSPKGASELESYVKYLKKSNQGQEMKDYIKKFISEVEAAMSTPFLEKQKEWEDYLEQDVP